MTHTVSGIRGVSPPDARPVLWVMLIFCASGACSLVYEVIWARHITLLVGHSSTAHAIVVATFMAGLAVGYVRLGRLGDRVTRPLRLYASLEAGIATWAFAFPWLYEAAVAVARSSGLSALGVGPTGLAVGVLLMGPPTVLMGGTLPVLVRVLSASGSPSRGAVASLYGVNSLGAVLGALIAGFVAIERFGLTTTLQGAALLNGMLALGAVWLARRAPLVAAETEVVSDAAVASPWPGLLLAVGVLGFVSLALQALWIRLAALILGSSTYAFAAVVAGFIAGITAGSLVARAWIRRRPSLDPMAALGAVTLVAAVVLWLTGALYERAPWEMARLRLGLEATDAGFHAWTTLQLAWVVGAVGAVTSLFGIGLPLAAEAYARAAGSGVAAHTGRVFAWNTGGAVVGAAAGAPVVMAGLGLAGAWQAATLTLAGLSAALLISRSEVSRRGWWVRPIAAVVLALWMAVTPPAWDARVMNAGAFRLRDLRDQDFASFREGLARSTLTFHEDGPDASVAVVTREGHSTLMVNGKPDASTRGDMLTQVASAHIPLLLHPDPSEVLVIGLGSGVTAGSAARHGVDVEVVELSAAVVRAASHFSEANGGALEHPRVRVVAEDARALLAHTERRWDVIISEPSNPWVAGNANLFTREFFQRVRSRLHEGGVLAQWIHLYESEDATVALVLRTLGEVFDHVTLWELHPNDLLLVASARPLKPDLAHMADRFTAALIQEDLRRVQVRSLAGLLSRQVLGPGGVEVLTGAEGPVHTDDHPILEYLAPRGLFKGERASALRALDGRTSTTADPTLELSRWLHDHPLSLEDARGLFILHTVFPSSPPAFRQSLLAQLVDEAHVSFLVQLLFTLETEGWWEQARSVTARLVERAPDDPAVLHVAARVRAQDLRAQGEDPAGDGEVRQWLARCVRLGDEPRGRCGRLQTRLMRQGSPP